MISNGVNKRVRMNISGQIYETLETTLSRYPETLLGNKEKRNKYLCPKSDELFFNRHHVSFGAILYFYQSYGRLSKPLDVSADIFEEECRFFEIPNFFISQMREIEGLLDMKREPVLNSQNSQQSISEKLWNLLENPESSKLATAFALFSFLMIALSIASTCLQTVPSVYGESDSWNREKWHMIEMILNTWFLTELVLRFICCPNKLEFAKQSLNIIDLLAVMPYFIMLKIKEKEVSPISFLRILRFARVIRLFRLTKHSKRLKVAGMILKSSFGDLKLLFFCLMVLNIFGGSVMYFIEAYDKESQFYSIPEALWWAIQTIVTLGYGDIVPITLLGRFIAATYMAFGALTMSLPVLSIVTKFSYMYEQNLKR